MTKLKKAIYKTMTGGLLSLLLLSPAWASPFHGGTRAGGSHTIQVPFRPGNTFETKERGWTGPTGVEKGTFCSDGGGGMTQIDPPTTIIHVPPATLPIPEPAPHPGNSGGTSVLDDLEDEPVLTIY